MTASSSNAPVSKPALRARQAPGRGKPSVTNSGAPAVEQPRFYTSRDKTFAGNIARKWIITPALCYAGFWKFVFSGEKQLETPPLAA